MNDKEYQHALDLMERGIRADERAKVIEEFVNAMKKYYWDSELQMAKDDPCIVDAMIDLAIRTAKQLNEQSNSDK